MPLYSGSTSISEVTGLQAALDGKQVAGSYGPKFSYQGITNCPAGGYTLPVVTNGYFDLRIPQGAPPNTTPYVVTIPNESTPTVIGNTHLICFEPSADVGSTRPIEFRKQSGDLITGFAGSTTLGFVSGHRYFVNSIGNGWVAVPPPADLADKSKDGQYTILVHHATALSPAAGGSTVFFGYPSDLAAVTSNSERGFSVPVTGKIIAVSMTTHNSITNGTSPTLLTARLRVWNKSGGSPVLDESWTGTNPATDNGRHPYGQTHRTVNWSLNYNANLIAGETYVMSAEIPATGGTQAAGIRHYVNLLIQRY